jgi:signal transduction histidine kinase
MKKSFIIIVIVIQILALFIFENMHAIFKNMENAEIENIIEKSEMRADAYLRQYQQHHVLRQDIFFKQIRLTDKPDHSREIISTEQQQILLLKRAATAESGLLFEKTIQSTQLQAFRSAKKILSGMAIFLGFFIVACGFYLVILFRKSKPEKSAESISPFQDYLIQMKNAQLELQNLMEEQNKSSFKKEELNKTIINTIHLAVMLLNPAGKIEIFNPSAQKLFARSFANAKNNSLDQVLRNFPEVVRFIENNQKKNSAEIEAGPFVFFIDVVPVADGGKLVLIRDISEERKKEKIQQQNANLMMLGEMAASLAHEIRNSLGIILGYSKAIHSEPEKTRKISQEIHFLSEMMESFLKFAKPVAKITRQKTDLGLMIGSIAANQDMTVDISGAELQLESDPLLLNVIFSNLILNAKQAGAGRLKVELIPGETATITIADDGPGIAPVIQEKIWLPFFSTREKGTGMGLPTIKKLVNTLNGDIQLLVNVKNGAAFRIVFYS